MIERAYISGPLGRAIALERSTAWLLSVDDPTTPVSCAGRDLSEFLDSGAEFFEMSGDGLSLESIRRTLHESTDAAEGLTRLLNAMNPKLSEPTRALSIEVANDLLAAPQTQAFIRARMVGIAMPEGIDLPGARALAKNTGAECARRRMAR